MTTQCVYLLDAPSRAAESGWSSAPPNPEGYNRSACFYADEDYALYLDHLEELSRKFRCGTRRGSRFSGKQRRVVKIHAIDSSPAAS
jgi:hypothetical protein